MAPRNLWRCQRAVANVKTKAITNCTKRIELDRWEMDTDMDMETG